VVASPVNPTPAVSVVLPAFNAAATLSRAIASLRAQTLSAWELIVIDDGSTDATAEIVRQARDDARVRLFRQPHAGIVAALNRGLAEARAPLIARLDADDVCHPDRLGEQCALLAAAPSLGVASCLVEHGGDRDRTLGYALHVDWINASCEPDDIRRNRFVEAPLAHPTVVFRREIVERHGGYASGDFPEDYELWLRWLDAGVAFAKVRRALLTWHDSPGRLSRLDPRYRPDAFFALKAPWIARELSRRGITAERAVWVWGAGRPTRKRAQHLERYGVTIGGFIDVDEKKIGGIIGGRHVVGPDTIPGPRDAFVLGYVSSRGARDWIREALRTKGYRETDDFLMCA